MCSRYFIEMSPELIPYIEAAEAAPLTAKMMDRLKKPLKTEGEIFPTDMVPVIASDKNRNRAVFPMLWGFHSKGPGRPLINARVETADQKPSFRDAWNTRRCVVPASCYFEWSHHKTPDGKTRTGDKYAIRPASGTPTYLAALYQIEEHAGLKYPAFTILTREPGRSIRSLHDRMPVILPQNSISAWIDPTKPPEEIHRIAAAAITEVVAEEVRGGSGQFTLQKINSHPYG